MKKNIVVSLFLIIFGLSSYAGAYSYSFDFQSGGMRLDVAANSEMISLITTDDLVVDMNFDLPPEGMLLKYTASVDANLALFFGLFNMPLKMDNLVLGSFMGIDPAGFSGDGNGVVGNYSGSQRIDSQFGQYALTDALLDYNITFTQDQNYTGQNNPGRYAINIETFSISEGNTSEMLWGILSDLSSSDMVPDGVSLIPPITLFGSLTGTVDIQADPVPVPAAIWLLGSGILGLVGFKRRQK